MKKLTIIGSTGSIGVNTLEIIRKFPNKFKVIALGAKQNIKLLKEQIEEFKPKFVCLSDKKKAVELKNKISKKNYNTKILDCEKNFEIISSLDEIDMFVSAIVGSKGLLPTISAIKSKKQIALANKETLVMAGEIIMKLAKENDVKIIPIDSEHSAIFQCMKGYSKKEIAKIILTASGGPFLNKSLKEIKNASIENALNHPNWNMGAKISIDSATLINKGLEVIEAMHLFNFNIKNINVIIHPQSIVHSLIEFKDSSILAQMGKPDMKGSIAYALSYPDRLNLKLKSLDLSKISSLCFQKPDLKKFPCLKLAYNAAKVGKTMPAVLNASNEIAVEAFLNKKISFNKIYETIQETIKNHETASRCSLQEIIKADKWARKWSLEYINNI